MFRLVNHHKELTIPYGFKIHLSATRESYQSLFSLVYPFLLEKDVCFKYIEKEEDVFFHFSEQESPAESGKYMTIYPQSRQECLELLEALYERIPKDYPGIHILSDRAYKDSNVIFYRYGFFEDLDEYNVEGVPTLLGPDGEVWQDYQKAYFDLPPWEEDLQEPFVFKESALLFRYDIIGCLRNGNGGMIYRGVDRQNQKEVVIKEARPHVISYGDVDKTQLRCHEYQMSQRCKGMPGSPKPIESCKEWINDYYIYEAIAGKEVIEVADEISLFAYDSKQPNQNRLHFQEFLKLARSILALVESFHHHQVVLNDLHANNIIVTPQKELYVVDMENSYFYNKPEENLVGIYNEISLQEWNGVDGYVADCHKIGNLLLFLLGRLQVKSIEEFQPGLVTTLLSHYGIQSNFAELIDYLFSEKATVSEAKAMLETIFVVPSNEVYELDYSFFTDLPVVLPLAKVLDKEKLALYLKHATNDDRLKTLIYREHNMGLDGLAGVLVLMDRGEVSSVLKDEVVHRIKQQITKTAWGYSIAYGTGFASPYLSSGTAGVLKSLAALKHADYESLANLLTNGLLVEYAQHDGYRNGMLGVSDTLLDLYAQTGRGDLLSIVERQLIVLSIKATYQPSLHAEYIYVLSRYRSLKNESFIHKQAV